MVTLRSGRMAACNWMTTYSICKVVRFANEQRYGDWARRRNWLTFLAGKGQGVKVKSVTWTREGCTITLNPRLPLSPSDMGKRKTLIEKLNFNWCQFRKKKNYVILFNRQKFYIYLKDSNITLNETITYEACSTKLIHCNSYRIFTFKINQISISYIQTRNIMKQ